MTILDACAVLAYMSGEPAASEVETMLRRRDRDPVRLTSTGVAEVVDQLARVFGLGEETAMGSIGQLRLLDAVPVDRRLGAAAGRLRARRYHRSRCAVSLADCVAAEAARASNEALATSDPHLLDVCLAEAIPAMPLLDSGGRRWTAPTGGPGPGDGG